MNAKVKITDIAIWIKHVDDEDLKSRLENLAEEDLITLETDGVIGRWRKLRTSKDGRSTYGVRPVGAMKEVWKKWYQHRCGEMIGVREVQLSDDYLATITCGFAEWASADDENAFRRL